MSQSLKGDPGSLLKGHGWVSQSQTGSRLGYGSPGAMADHFQPPSTSTPLAPSSDPGFGAYWMQNTCLCSGEEGTPLEPPSLLLPHPCPSGSLPPCRPLGALGFGAGATHEVDEV